MTHVSPTIHMASYLYLVFHEPMSMSRELYTFTLIFNKLPLWQAECSWLVRLLRKSVVCPYRQSGRIRIQNLYCLWNKHPSASMEATCRLHAIIKTDKPTNLQSRTRATELDGLCTQKARNWHLVTCDFGYKVHGRLVDYRWECNSSLTRPG